MLGLYLFDILCKTMITIKSSCTSEGPHSETMMMMYSRLTASQLTAVTAVTSEKKDLWIFPTHRTSIPVVLDIVQEVNIFLNSAFILTLSFLCPIC